MNEPHPVDEAQVLTGLLFNDPTPRGRDIADETSACDCLAIHTERARQETMGPWIEEGRSNSVGQHGGEEQHDQA